MYVKIKYRSPYMLWFSDCQVYYVQLCRVTFPTQRFLMPVFQVCCYLYRVPCQGEIQVTSTCCQWRVRLLLFLFSYYTY